MANTDLTPSPEPPKVAELLGDIGRDVKTIAVDELELARRKLTAFMEQLVIKVVALAPVIPALWVRLLVMAVVYIAIGGGTAVLFGRRLASMRGPDLGKQYAEIGETIKAVERGLGH